MCRWPAPHTIYPALLYTWLGQFWIVCYVTSYCRSYVHLVFVKSCPSMSYPIISCSIMSCPVMSMSSNVHVQLCPCQSRALPEERVDFTCSHVNIPRLNLSQLVLRDTTVRLRRVRTVRNNDDDKNDEEEKAHLCVHLLLVVAGAEGRKDQVSVVHHLHKIFVNIPRRKITFLHFYLHPEQNI